MAGLGSIEGSRPARENLKKRRHRKLELERILSEFGARCS